jgi:hypothetical protein
VKARHVLVVAALVALAGCTPAPKETPIAIATPDTRTVYLDALGAIDRALVENEQAAMADGHNICVDIQQGKTTGELRRNAADRFEVDIPKARQILAVTESKLCSAAG